MAKSTTRSRGKKKLQDVIESIPDDGENAGDEIAEEAGGTTAKKRPAKAGKTSKPASDESQFVANEEPAEESGEDASDVVPEGDKTSAAEEVAEPGESSVSDEVSKKKKSKKKGEYDDGSPIDRATHEKYEKIKRGELHIKDLQKMSVAELHEVAKDEGVEEYVGLPKQDLIFQILKRRISQNGLLFGEGVLEVLPDGFGFLRSPEYNYLPCPDDIYVSPSQIRRFGLRNGHIVAGQIRPPKESERVFRAASRRGD